MSDSLASVRQLRGPVALSHLLLKNFVRTGSQLVDATCGNGKDTLLLARLAGETGHLYAFDIQKEAIERTFQRLSEQGLQDRVTLINDGHERILELLDSQIDAIVFNLGWLPGASREITTSSSTTIKALESSLLLLAPSGLLIVTCYPGHQGGDEEAVKVKEWAADLASKTYHVWQMGQVNVRATAPFCLVIQKSESSTDAP